MIHLDVTQGSAEWADLRLALPTASQFHRIITAAKLKPSAAMAGYRDDLLAEWALGYGVTNAESGFMERGKDLESDARAWYELQTDNEVTPGGFVLTDDRRAGCSPDGLIDEPGGLEIKCLSAPNHIGILLNGMENEHKCQVQGSLYITGREWWDVVFYSPALPSLIIRVERDEAFMAAFPPALTQFCEMLDAGKRALAALGVESKLPPVPVRGLEMVA